MDIQKERKAFEAWLKSLNENGRTTYFLGQESTVAWEAWQAAKAQAVPEGFVLVPKVPHADLVNHGHQVFLGHFNEGGQTGGRSLYFAYKAMIEAQEPANEL
ncbi:hypothetical protein KTH22_01145 [Acinetobacter variabilis]|uniref:hypothetical protein n=1 Tax=Acinetobacter variabilis TaxID=70346 RepID=UPI0021D1C45F|nr:hypothetical protein [Acinetobacter variabilis]MCU4373752.1 hypothetical protein [Acinetobacter variabilis]